MKRSACEKIVKKLLRYLGEKYGKWKVEYYKPSDGHDWCYNITNKVVGISDNGPTDYYVYVYPDFLSKAEDCHDYAHTLKELEKILNKYIRSVRKSIEWKQKILDEINA